MSPSALSAQREAAERANQKVSSPEAASETVQVGAETLKADYDTKVACFQRGNSSLESAPLQEPSFHINVVVVGMTGVGKSSLINMIMGVPDGSKGAAQVSRDAYPCTMLTTSYTCLLGTGLLCQLWDTRGFDEVTYGRTFMAKIVDRIRQLASQQARELKETLRNRTRVARPILMWCMDASKIEVDVCWEPLRRVYVEYCDRKVIPVLVITRGLSRQNGWELRCREQLEQLDLGVDVPMLMVRRHRNSSSLQYTEDAQALRDLISQLATQ